jgi:pimeloyl-ACP methyl ester carboxylesterase
MTSYKTVTIEGLDIFYREAGSPDDPTILLLHGFPTSSHMFRNLIQVLSDRFHLVAPDYPGFGNSSMPSVEEYEYSFDGIAQVIDSFTEKLGLHKYSLYMMDIAVKHPERVESMIVQNGNAYEEGLREFWDPIKAYWKEKSKENGDVLRNSLLT